MQHLISGATLFMCVVLVGSLRLLFAERLSPSINLLWKTKRIQIEIEYIALGIDALLAIRGYFVMTTYAKMVSSVTVICSLSVSSWFWICNSTCKDQSFPQAHYSVTHWYLVWKGPCTKWWHRVGWLLPLEQQLIKWPNQLRPNTFTAKFVAAWSQHVVYLAEGFCN